MCEYRKKPGVAFWATVVLVVLLAYPLSWGPVAWARSRQYTGDTLDRAILVLYAPLFEIRRLPVLDPLFDAYTRWWYPTATASCTNPGPIRGVEPEWPAFAKSHDASEAMEQRPPE